MIGYLRGKLYRIQRLEQDLALVLLDVCGVGYEFYSSLGLADSLEKHSGNDAQVIVYTDVRENAITLYGFASSLERELFLLLKKVKGVGSRTALALIAAVGCDALLRAIGESDHSILVTAPGVGKKTAERIIVELRERVADYVVEPISRSASSSKKVSMSSKTTDSVVDDVKLALEKLGFQRTRAESAAGLAWEAISSDEKRGIDAGELLRRALAIAS